MLFFYSIVDAKEGGRPFHAFSGLGLLLGFFFFLFEYERVYKTLIP